METFQNGGQRLSIKGKKRRFGNTLRSENVSPGKCLPGLVLTVKTRSLNASMDVRSFVAFS